MKLYKIHQTFDRRTGKPLPNGEPFETGNYICDYSGELIDNETESEYTPQYEFSFDYNSDCEEVYYYDDDKEFFEDEQKVHYGHMLGLPYHFKVDDEYSDKSFELIEEWMKCVKTKKGDFKDCLTLEQACRIARVRTVKRLLTEHTYTAAELGLEPEEY